MNSTGYVYVNQRAFCYEPLFKHPSSTSVLHFSLAQPQHWEESASEKEGPWKSSSRTQCCG